MNKYIVKTKYTYEKTRQTDYTHSASEAVSGNIIEGRYITKSADMLCTCRVSSGCGAEIALTPAQSERLVAVSGVKLHATCGEGDGICKLTLFGESGESFMSVAKLCDVASGVLFSTLDMDFVPVKILIETTSAQEIELTASLFRTLNPLGEWGGQASFYSVSGGSLCDDGEKMKLSFSGEVSVESPEFPDSSNTVYNMLMPRRNTILAILGNNSTAKEVKLYFTTYEHPEYSEEANVTLPLAASDMPAPYHFNLSASPLCTGRLKSFKLLLDGEGELIIYRYSFEQEAPLWDAPVRYVSCIADKERGTVTVKGKTDSQLFGKVKIYMTNMLDEGDTTKGKTCVGEGVLDNGELIVDGISLYDGNVSRLSAQFVAFLENGGRPVRLTERFYIENYELFDSNPYTFELPNYSVSALDFGALGDAYHNDTDAIQAAIDHVYQMGGGRVVINGSSDRYGRRYIVTNLLMRSCVELHIEKGAVLWQSQIRRDYPYAVTYGHDGYVEGVNWTHNMHVSNLPLIQAENSHHIKITGQGKLRGMDIGSEEGVDMHMRFSSGCVDRIHLIMVGFFNVEHVECRDIEIVRCNNYHTAFYHCAEVYAANLKFHEVKCLSGDGIGIMIGTHDVTVHRCFVQSNDDYLVLVSVYNDPRGMLWWTNAEGTHCGPYNVTLRHSYVDAGTGGGVAFITWGTNDPIQERAEIHDIYIYDNYFGGHKGIGGWFDNPYNGKVPFDNTENDDYSPVRKVRIYNNRYTEHLTMGPVHCTDYITDCGLYSHYDFVNGDFTLGGLANWTAGRNESVDSVKTVIYCNKEKGCISCFDEGDVSLSQGLYLLSGKYKFSCELMTNDTGAELYACDIQSGELIFAEHFACRYPAVVETAFELDRARDIYIGVRSADNNPDSFAIIDFCRIDR